MRCEMSRHSNTRSTHLIFWTMQRGYAVAVRDNSHHISSLPGAAGFAVSDVLTHRARRSILEGVGARLLHHAVFRGVPRYLWPAALFFIIQCNVFAPYLVRAVILALQSILSGLTSLLRSSLGLFPRRGKVRSACVLFCRVSAGSLTIADS